MKKIIFTLACCAVTLTAAAQYRPGYRIERPRTVHPVRTIRATTPPPTRTPYRSRYSNGFHYNDGVVHYQTDGQDHGKHGQCVNGKT